MLVDSHTHVYDIKKGYVLPQDIIPVVVGYSHGSNRKTVEAARQGGYPFALGIAPQTAIREDLQGLDDWIAFIKEAKPNAIGEVGLDYKWAKDGADVEKELLVFKRMIGLADEMGLPLVIHSRDRPAAESGKEGVPENAVDDVLGYLGGKRFVMHFFSGSAGQAQKAVAMGGYISMTHMRSKERRNVINTVPLDRLMVETDSPFVGRTPEAARDAVAYIAEVKGLEPQAVEKATADNARIFFGF